MAEFNPIKVWQVAPEYAQEVASMPYDVVDEEEAKQQLKLCKNNFIQIDKPEICGAVTDTDDTQYKCAAFKLKELLHKGIFIPKPETFYLYEIQEGENKRQGLMGGISCKEYGNNIIKKHEATRTCKVIDRSKHIAYCGAHTGPIFLTYQDHTALNDWLKQYALEHMPILEVKDIHSVTHRLYSIDQIEAITFIQNDLKGVESLYIADGHHRMEAAYEVYKAYEKAGLNMEEVGCVLAVLFPASEMQILAYDRVIKDESGLEEEVLLQRLSQHFTVELLSDHYYKPIHKRCMGMRYHKKWYALCFKAAGEEEAEKMTDAACLQHYVLNPIFHIKQPEKDERIGFVGGIGHERCLNALTEGEWDIAFSLYPVTLTELMEVAEQGNFLPPKSTWFEPKLQSGLVIHPFA